jgi:nucleoside-diphosphate-sugar epimerase
MSTSEVYGSAQSIPMTETHVLQPQSPYSASKIAADSVAMSYFHSYGTDIVIARPFNTYGPRQSRRAIIPAIISQLVSQVQNVRLGNLDAIRDFTYVADTCRLLCELAVCGQSQGEVINIGSGQSVSVSQLFNTICELMCLEAEIQIDKERLRPKSSEVTELVCDNSKLLKLTSSSPKIHMEEGLTTTINWFAERAQLSTALLGQEYMV